MQWGAVSKYCLSYRTIAYAGSAARGKAHAAKPALVKDGKGREER